ncbi:aldo/keto reductase [Collimonas silvisoli]|uniref:aldo/keto reductase n=1 Tax=Collimonas silvisoli TaxID=2825884 RepID=UPI001E4F7518|nr:aldo/keto reductase [Collimonas silvisoli]
MNCPRATLLNDLTLSRITAGMWRLMDWNMSDQELLGYIDACLALGVTSFDHADIYGDYGVEDAFGKALRIRPSLRAEIELVTKVGIALVSPARPEHRLKHYNTGPAHIRHTVERSLRSFNTDYLDLLLIHRPDPLMRFDEVAAEVEKLKQAGKIKAFGVSNFTPAQFQAVHSFTPLATNQIELSPFHTSPLTDGTLDQLQSIGAPPMIWSALGGGRLFTEGDSAAARIRATASQIAERHGVSVPTIIYAWLLQLPSSPIVITGSRRLGGLRDAVSATALQLERQDWFALLEAATGIEVA